MPAPGGSYAVVILLHQYCSYRTDWFLTVPFAEQLAERLGAENIVGDFGPFQGDGQRIAVQGLGNEIRSVQLQGADGGLHLAKGRGHDEGA